MCFSTGWWRSTGAMSHLCCKSTHLASPQHWFKLTHRCETNTHTERLCSGSLVFVYIFFSHLKHEHEGCEGEGKNRGKSVSRCIYTLYFLFFFTQTGNQERSRNSFLFVADFIHKADVFHGPCVCAAVPRIANLSKVVFVLQVFPHYKHFPDQSCWKGFPLQTSIRTNKYAYSDAHL